MAIDHTTLGGYEIFPMAYNWNEPPSIKLNPERQVIGYPGTSQEILSTITKVPTRISINVLLYNKTIEKMLLDFFVARKGRLGKFWLKHPLSNYTLYTTGNDGEDTIKINPTGFDSFWTGDERIFLKHTNGNSCIKKVTNAVLGSSPGLHTLLTLDSVLVDEWLVDDSRINMGQVILVRFDKDDISISYTTDRVAEVTLEMVELLYEYVEV